MPDGPVGFTAGGVPDRLTPKPPIRHVTMRMVFVESTCKEMLEAAKQKGLSLSDYLQLLHCTLDENEQRKEAAMLRETISEVRKIPKVDADEIKERIRERYHGLAEGRNPQVFGPMGVLIEVLCEAINGIEQ